MASQTMQHDQSQEEEKKTITSPFSVSSLPTSRETPAELEANDTKQGDSLGATCPANTFHLVDNKKVECNLPATVEPEASTSNGDDTNNKQKNDTKEIKSETKKRKYELSDLAALFKSKKDKRLASKVKSLSEDLEAIIPEIEACKHRYVFIKRHLHRSTVEKLEEVGFAVNELSSSPTVSYQVTVQAKSYQEAEDVFNKKDCFLSYESDLDTVSVSHISWF